jgi:single-stranded-DNA-specific exonuclease
MSVSLESTATWTAPARQPEAERRLQDALGIPSLVAAVLVARGWTDPEKTHEFLNPSLDNLHDPRLLPDYEEAQNLILAAKEAEDLIFVHGDYDVDGVTSAALFNRFLTNIGCKVKTHVPHRMREGYGIHLSAVDAAIAEGAKLFLTCDCGTAAHEQIEKARQAGMRVVVTDHHEIGEEAPDAHAFMNPHRKDSQYPFPELSGVGVVFKLCEGITAELGHERRHFQRAFLDLAALGTVADVMPLTGENRIIAKFGLERIQETKKVGLRALLERSEALKHGALKAWHIGFVLGPRLNAAGRIDDAALALQLLLENDPATAANLAEEIEAINKSRREEQQRIVDEAVELVQAKELHKKNVIVVGDKGWHPGIIGIVAGRLVEQFRRPCFVVSVDPETGVGKGSARTIEGFHLAEAIRHNPDCFTSGGGHAMAAGFSLDGRRLDEIGDALHSYAGEFLTEEHFKLVVTADAEVEQSEVTLAALEALTKLEPFGCANPEPAFIARCVKFSEIIATKNPLHSRVSVRTGNGPITKGIAFNLGERLGEHDTDCDVDVLFKPKIDEWNGSRRLQWDVKDYIARDLPRPQLELVSLLTDEN